MTKEPRSDRRFRLLCRLVKGDRNDAGKRSDKPSTFMEPEKDDYVLHAPRDPYDVD